MENRIVSDFERDVKTIEQALDVRLIESRRAINAARIRLHGGASKHQRYVARLRDKTANLLDYKFPNKVLSDSEALANRTVFAYFEIGFGSIKKLKVGRLNDTGTSVNIEIDAGSKRQTKEWTRRFIEKIVNEEDKYTTELRTAQQDTVRVKFKKLKRKKDTSWSAWGEKHRGRLWDSIKNMGSSAYKKAEQAIQEKNQALHDWKDDKIEKATTWKDAKKQALHDWKDDQINQATAWKDDQINQATAWKDEQIDWVTDLPSRAKKKVRIEACKKMEESCRGVGLIHKLLEENKKLKKEKWKQMKQSNADKKLIKAAKKAYKDAKRTKPKKKKKKKKKRKKKSK